MNCIKIIGSGKYLPTKKVLNNQLEKELNLNDEYIYKMTGIKQRYYSLYENIEEMALKAVKDIFDKNFNISKEDIGLIITATTSTNNLMPGISNYIQEKMKMKSCICLDILAGCSGYINAFDIAKMYIEAGKTEKALVIGVEKLSDFVNKEDVGTAIILSDGAGATLIQKNVDKKMYFSNIEADGEKSNILTCKSGEKIYMQGKEVYKYAVTKTVENIQELLEQSNEKIENIKYIVPHQSNIRIMKAIANRLKIEEEKMYINIENVGNTFCASIPIAIDEIIQKDLLNTGDKIILLGYGGGLNTGSILFEI